MTKEYNVLFGPCAKMQNTKNAFVNDEKLSFYYVRVNTLLLECDLSYLNSIHEKYMYLD